MNKNDPIAIVGIGCRFPGCSNSPEEFWNMLKDGVDAITEVPDDRWDVNSYYDPEFTKKSRISVRTGGFIDEIDMFDAGFFGISPREAAYIDPQHRILLEVAFQAIEDSGHRVEELNDSDTGVFIGISSHDYGDIQTSPTERVYIGPHTMVGSASSIASNRISYLFNLKGPSLSIDTACSSALNAIHVACQSIWNADCDKALVGGVNIMLKPDITMAFSKGGFLSPDGRSYTFDDRANGYIRSEGAGVIFLKPLSKALENDDKIYSTIICSAVNQDGATDGISFPNEKAQKKMLAYAYKKAGISPTRVQYIEAHGTGTAAGDPIEAKSIGEVIGAGREKGNECIVNSVKANIGHLEPASGIAGIIKLALSMKKMQIPKNIHFENPNPKIPFKELNLKVPKRLMAWPKTDDGIIYGGVNSFGFGGANAHVVMKSIPKINTVKKKQTNNQLEIFTLSARSFDALKAYAKKFIEYLETNKNNPKISINDICYTASVRKSHHNHRLAVIIKTKKELIKHLNAFLINETRTGMTYGRPLLNEKLETVFIFSGQGPQWWAMGRELYQNEPVFRESIDECGKMIDKYTDWSFIEEFTAAKDKSRIDETHIAQPSIFALQVALTKLWESLGVVPSAVVGHSVGEVAAAYISGHLSLEDAARVIVYRSKVQNRASGKGKMLAVGLSEEELKKEIAGLEDKISIGAINAPSMIALSGDSEPIEKLAESFDKRDIFHRFLRVSIPFHSHHMQPLKEELIESLQGLELKPFKIPLYSTVTGKLANKKGYNPEYWFRNVRQPVRFTDAISSIIEDGYYPYFVEISPHPILFNGVNELLNNANKKGIIVSSIRRKEKEMQILLGNLGSLHTAGFNVDFKKIYKDGNFIDLPFYPWQKEHFWIESDESRKMRIGIKKHPFFKGHTVSSHSKNEQYWDIDLDVRNHTYIADHKVQGPIIFPGAGYVELAISTALDGFEDDFCFLEDINFQKVLFLPENDDPAKIQFEVSGNDGIFHICSKSKKDKEWIKHVEGKINHQGDKFISQKIDLSKIRKRITDVVPVEELYTELWDSGLKLGPTFQVIDNLWRKDCNDCVGESIGEINVPKDLQTEYNKYNLHPAILDACFQALFGSAYIKYNPDDKVGVYIPVHIDRVKFHKKTGSRLWSYCRLLSHKPEAVIGDIWIIDDNGNICAEFQGFQGRYLEGSRGDQENILARSLYEHKWKISERDSQAIIRDPENYIPPPPSIRGKINHKIEEIKARPLQNEYFNFFEPELNKLTTAYIVKGLKDLGFNFKPGTAFTNKSIIKKYKIVEQHHQLLNRMLEILKKNRTLKKEDSKWIVKKQPVEIDSNKLYDTLLKKYPDFIHELTLLGRCGPHIAEVVKGEIEPVLLLFPEEEWEAIVTFYKESFSFKKYNEIVRESVKNLLIELPEDQTLRILEIGAGTGGMTSAVLPIFPPDRTEYTFTDVSQMFMVQAEERYGSQYPFLKFKVLDIEKNPEDQDIDLHSYDLIIASNVLHATKYLRDTLKNVQKLLASKGVLIMLEVTQCPWWIDLVFGMTEGWWMFKDLEIRPNHPSLSEKKWHMLLNETGFTDILGITDVTGKQAAQHVFLAKNKKFNIEKPALKLPDSIVNNPGKWLIFKDNKGISDRLAEKLEAQGQTCIMVTRGNAFKSIDSTQFEAAPANQEDIKKILADITKGDKQLHGILHLWSLDNIDSGKISIDSLENSFISGCTSVINLLRELLDLNLKKQPNLWLITSGAQPIETDNEIISIDQASIWGLGRVIMNEHLNLPCTCIDVGLNCNDEEIQSLFDEICQEDQEEEIALRGKKRYIHKLLRFHPENAEEKAMKKIEDGKDSFHLTIDQYGMLDNLAFRESVRIAPGPGEIEVEVHASALNFKDVMLAMGMLDDAALENVYTGNSYGMECSGKIIAIGKGVTGFKIGDEVLAIGPDCFSSSIITKSSLAVKKPSFLSHIEAASIPMAYLTAYYSLIYQGKISKDDKILIHSASGGIGLAAIELAKLSGAEIYATAGNNEKREYLRSHGIQHVMDSRTLDFSDKILELTDGKGVDIVLNSLSGKGLSKSVNILSRYGRFIEISKSDIYNSSKLNLRPFANNLTYSAVDIDKLLVDQDELCGEILRKFIKLFKEKKLTPHPYKIFPASKITDAFHFMAQAKHIGKIIINMKDENIKAKPSKNISTIIKSDCSYLITGGCSGFGLSIAKWLSDKGALQLILVSRSGAKTNEEKQVIKEMRNNGVEIFDARADVTSEEQIAGIIAECKKNMPPLRGIIHAAMVIEDTVLVDIDHEKLMKVVRPKAMGAWILHKLTLNMPLDFFISFSSMTTIYGNAGQGNYSAANAFLDAFSYYRRSKGLPATTINWGVIGEVGYVSRNTKVSNILASQGWKSFNRKQSIEIIEKMLLLNPIQMVALDAVWPTVAKFFPMAIKSPRFSHLVFEGQDAKSNQSGAGSSLKQTIFAASPDKQGELLQKQVHEQIARILGTSSSKIDIQDPISSMGLDSLMANQLRNWIQQNLNLDFSMMRIIRGPTVVELTQLLLDDMRNQESEEGPDDSANEIDRWILRKNPNHDAKMRLFCFPYMGGGASTFFEWADLLSSEIEVCSVQLPGREERVKEKAFDDIDKLVAKLTEVILPLLDKPFAFYGHSFGAGIAFKLLHYLSKNHGLLSEHLFVGAWFAPHLKSPFRVVDKVKDNDFNSIPESLIFKHLRTLEIPESILSNAELMNEMMPAIKADILMGKRYKHTEKKPLGCPITAFAGKDDTVFSINQVNAWSKHSGDTFKLEVIPGNHLFLNNHKKALLKIIYDKLN